MPRIKSPTTSYPRQTFGISSDEYDMALVYEIIKDNPDITVSRVKGKGDVTYVELKGSRDDMALLIGTYNTRISERVQRLKPGITYDEIKTYLK